jgi:hypothetical protein
VAAVTPRQSLVWLGMTLAGLALGAYVLAAWPDNGSQLVRLPYGEAMPKTPGSPQTVRRIASATTASYAAPELASLAEEVYPLELYFYELSPAPLLDSLISAQPLADAH